MRPNDTASVGIHDCHDDMDPHLAEKAVNGDLIGNETDPCAVERR